MRQTLFYWPHETAGFPWFGALSWATLILLAIAVVQLAAAKNAQSRSEVIQSNALMWGIAFLAIAFLLPRIEFRIEDVPIGLPIRGYGVLLMAGVITGTYVALKRCEARGIPREAFLSLATWTVATGIVGARLFYVIQYWGELPGQTLGQKLWTVLQVTEGGLVVYGSVIGGLIVILVWAIRYKLPVLVVADAVTPAFFLGLMFGRLGCLMNGCCYGGVCEMPLPTVRFPSGSAVYMEQLESGRILGLVTDQGVVTSVKSPSWADSNGVQPNAAFGGVQARVVSGPTPTEPYLHPKFDAIVNLDGKTRVVSAVDLPERAIPVHPSQVYASIGGLILFLWTMSLSSLITRTGYLFSLGLIAYGVVRILEELIRVDEGGQFGTSLSIATWISMAGILGGIVLLIALRTRPVGISRA
ncbi:MAG: prolipoprotein diacylglyceryl transferase [Pirellula sp.]|jgi:phosphatidylglycerol:prolipoprotein diacylglycerol transferase|nr:prolipoprotein diacylglyceryl transferase [Pirellula sp.]